MSLKSKIISDHLEAFKARNMVKKSILSVVKGEIQTVEKNTNEVDLSDDGVTKILTKMIKSLKETIEKSDDETSKLELEVLSDYMPKQWGHQEISAKLKDLLVGKESLTIGEVMRAFAKDPVDKKMVAKIWEEN